MPAQRPSAAFDPIPPDLDLLQLVEETPNFEYVTRISCDMIAEQGLDSFDKLVLLHVILGGKPLVIEGFQNRLDGWTFTNQWLQDNCGTKFEQAWNLSKHQYMPISIAHYLTNMSKLTDQWTRENFRELDRQRIYLKDIDCPPIWHSKLKEQIPPSVFYMNESTGEYGGPGSDRPEEQGVARAGDLMSCLPSPMRADNMMCYIGHEGTYTPAHREMCASLGQNLMVETSHTRDKDGKPVKPGSSIWFMTETKDRHLVSEYWLSTLGHDIEVEAHFAQINAWKAAPFKTYIVDQRVGDFILIPPLAPHQVWNRGTRTMKAAWNRTTVETLEMALHEALPRARMVCRDEQYKNKAIVYFALDKYYGQLRQVQAQRLSGTSQIRYELDRSLKIRQLQKDFKRLFALYTEILLSEMLDPVAKTEKKGQYLPYDSFVTCSYCRCNIFNRFLTCTSCIKTLENGDEDTYDICMDCYAMGRSCACLSKYKWVEQFHWSDLISKHNAWRHLIIDFEGGVNEKSPLSLEMERKNMQKKPLAQVCQEQLRERPFVDPKKPPPAISAYERHHPGSAATDKDKDGDGQENGLDSEGNKRKSTSRKTRADKLPKNYVIEHVSLYPELRWLVASCNKCDRHYSYGSLFRMFDLMPQTVMENPEWECPACLKICSCGACRKKPDMKPHEPTGTVLGHDTKKVADPRSVDSLVNFSLPNLGWIKRLGDIHPHESRRLNRRIDEAEQAKAKDPTLDENYVDEEECAAPFISRQQELEIRYATDPEIAIDPMLLMDQSNAPNSGGSKQRANNNTNGTASQSTVNEGRPVSHAENNPGVAPVANMVGHDDRMQGFTSNGITYEYPEPSMINSTPALQSNGFAQPDLLSTRPVGTNAAQTGFAQSSQINANGQHLSQLEQMLAEAKLNNQYISTEARFTAKSLPVAFKVPKSGLASIISRPPVPKPSRPATVGAKAAAPIILQSDFPSTTSVEQPKTRKKRRSETEKDGDFPVGKRRDRKSSAAAAAAAATAGSPAKDTRKKAVKYTEPSSDSETNEATTATPVNKPSGSRQLPKYLAERKNDPPSSPATLIGKPSNKSPDVSKPPVDPALKLAEDNRKAKMKALQWASSDEDMSSSSDSSSKHPTIKPTSKPASKPMLVAKSIFNRPGSNGKKIKIVAAKGTSVNGNAAQKTANITRRY
ncbi:hypothetical protein ACLMJK_007322 [Lecanora helva]